MSAQFFGFASWASRLSGDSWVFQQDSPDPGGGHEVAAQMQAEAVAHTYVLPGRNVLVECGAEVAQDSQRTTQSPPVTSHLNESVSKVGFLKLFCSTLSDLVLESWSPPCLSQTEDPRICR